jgi:hypothetical protein
MQAKNCKKISWISKKIINITPIKLMRNIRYTRIQPRKLRKKCKKILHDIYVYYYINHIMICLSLVIINILISFFYFYLFFSAINLLLFMLSVCRCEVTVRYRDFFITFPPFILLYLEKLP